MKLQLKSGYIKMSAFIFFYFFAWSATIGFLAIWLGKTINLDGTQIGIVYAINGIFAVILKPIYGYIMDKIGMSKYLLYFVCAVSILMAPFFIYIYQPLLVNPNTMILGMIVGAIYLSFAWYAGVASCESYTDRFSRLEGFEFGQIRMWGSLGWACASAVAGLLFNINPNYNFILGSLTSILMLIILLTLKIDGKNKAQVISDKKIVFQDVIGLFKLSKFWFFCLYIAGVAWMMFIAEQQFPRYFVTFFQSSEHGNAMYGYLGTVQSACEFFMMMVIPLFVNYVGAKKGLLICGLVIGFRLIASGFIGSDLQPETAVILISIIKPLYGLEMSLLLISIFKYIAEHFDKKINATLYLLGYQAMLYIGNISISVPVGKLYDQIGFANTYILMGSCALIFTVISAFTLLNKSEKRENSKHLEENLCVTK